MKINDIIAAAAEDLGVSFENNALWFKVLINQAIRSHRTTKTLAHKKAELELYDCKAELPSGWIKIISVCKADLKLCPDIDYSIQDNFIIFDSSNSYPDGTQIQFNYLGLNTDDKGQIVIPDDWERMLVAYIGWKYTRRYVKDYGVTVMQNYQREYQHQKLFNI